MARKPHRRWIGATERRMARESVMPSLMCAAVSTIIAGLLAYLVITERPQGELAGQIIIMAAIFTLTGLCFTVGAIASIIKGKGF